MISRRRLLCLALAFACAPARAVYDLVEDYSGDAFFTGWDYYGSWDNLTSGDVWFLNETAATEQQLTYINGAGNAIIKVDNTSNVPWNDKRNTIRLQSKVAYPLGSLWIIDLVHLPYGCSVWPAFWTAGTDWPNNGEIDIIEGINLMTHNQMALHTVEGCTKTGVPGQTGSDGAADCGLPSGCVVTENKPNSYGPAFAAAGGGVWATQFDASGIYMWFWSRKDIPSNVNGSYTSSVDISTWGPPNAAYPSTSCEIGKYFGEQYLILDITLCGVWAGVPSIYNATCANHGPTGVCYLDNVIGPGSPEYDTAYFEIAYVRAFTQPGTLLPNATSSVAAPASSSSSSTTSGGGVSVTTGAPSSGSAGRASGARRAAGLDDGRGWTRTGTGSAAVGVLALCLAFL